MSKSNAKIVAIIGDKVVELGAIAALVIFVLYKDLDVYIAVTIIALMAGLNLGQLMKKGSGTGPTGAVTLIASGLIEATRRSIYLLPVVFFWLTLTLPSACAGPAAYAPIISQTLDIVADIVKNETGKDLQDLPTECEHELTPKVKMLLLCEVDLRGTK